MLRSAAARALAAPAPADGTPAPAPRSGDALRGTGGRRAGRCPGLLAAARADGAGTACRERVNPICGTEAESSGLLASRVSAPVRAAPENLPQPPLPPPLCNPARCAAQVKSGIFGSDFRSKAVLVQEPVFSSDAEQHALGGALAQWQVRHGAGARWHTGRVGLADILSHGRAECVWARQAAPRGQRRKGSCARCLLPPCRRQLRVRWRRRRWRSRPQSRAPCWELWGACRAGRPAGEAARIVLGPRLHLQCGGVRQA